MRIDCENTNCKHNSSNPEKNYMTFAKICMRGIIKINSDGCCYYQEEDD